jgi:hypothetical protein
MYSCQLALIGVLMLGQPVPGPATEAAPTKALSLTGLQLQAVPELLYSQLPQLPRNQGILVDQVTAGSLAAKLDLQRYDVLLTYDGKPVRDPEQFHKLVRTTKLDQKAPLVLLRAGKEVKLDVALHTTDMATSKLKGVIKPGGPPAVAIECTFLDGGKLEVVLAYYGEKSSKLQSVTCSGSLTEIEQQVRDQNLPGNIQELVDVAIKRLRKAN